MRSSNDVADEIAELAANLDSATQRLLTCIRTFDESGEWHNQGAVTCAHWLSWRIGLDLVTAREKVRVARALGALPRIDRALERGELSYAKVRAITRVATPATEETLLMYARHATGAQLDRICRLYRQVAATARDPGTSAEERSVRERVLPGGMVKLELVLTPDEAALILKAIDKAQRTLASEQTDAPAEASRDEGRRAGRSQRAADGAKAAADGAQAAGNHTRAAANHAHSAAARALAAARPTLADAAVLMAETYLHQQPHDGAPDTTTRHQLLVHLDQDVLAPDGQYAATLDDGTRLTPDALRRVACDAAVIATRTDAAGATLDVGRRTRAIPTAIRRALWLRDRGCRFPGCTHTRFLHGHHIHHWLHGGRTALDNLVLLCSRHHQLVHEGGFGIVVEDGALAFTTPARKPMFAVPALPDLEDATANLRIWAVERGVEIGPDTNMPWWDGEAPDYDAAITGLLDAG
jgi:hypothetical protein